LWSQVIHQEQGLGDNTEHRTIGSQVLSRRWLLVAPALLLLWIVGQIDKTNVSLVIADTTFLRELHLAGNNPMLGGLMSAFFVGYGISIFIWGFLVDRFGPQACAICGTLAWGVLIFLSSRVIGINEYLLIRFLLGFAEGNLWPVSNTLTNHWFPVSEHARAQTFWVTGVTLGTAAGVPVMTALMLSSGWRTALVWLSAVSLIPIGIISLVRDWPQHAKGISTVELQAIDSDRNKGFSLAHKSLGQVLRSAAFWLIMVCQIVAATTVYTMVQWIPSYITAFRHVPFQIMGRWITAGYSLATILTLGIGYVADRTMQRSLTGAGACLLFVVLVVPGSLLLSPFGSAVALSALIAVPSATAALNGALLYALVRPKAVPLATGIYVGIANIASAIGPALFGGLINATGGQFAGGFLFLALLGIVGAGCYFALHRLSSQPERSLAGGREESVYQRTSDLPPGAASR
jgi:sugar phosphate permease